MKTKKTSKLVLVLQKESLRAKKALLAKLNQMQKTPKKTSLTLKKGQRRN
jgi:hypothetical protein